MAHNISKNETEPTNILHVFTTSDLVSEYDKAIWG